LIGGEISTLHGAPLRLRVARQLGYKSIKYLSRITVTDSLKDIGQGLGSISWEIRYSWYAGISGMDHHAIAAISSTGICLDVFGGLYLAYDLLGGQHGPLRVLTRMVTYSIVFGIGGWGWDSFSGSRRGWLAGLRLRLS